MHILRLNNFTPTISLVSMCPEEVCTNSHQKRHTRMSLTAVDNIPKLEATHMLINDEKDENNFDTVTQCKTIKPRE